MAIVVGTALAASVLLAWTQPWFELDLRAGGAIVSSLSVSGSEAVPQLSGLAMASLALFVAMSLARRRVRVLLAAIEIVLGLGVAWASFDAMLSPVSASRRAVSEVSAITDMDAVRDVVSKVSMTLWPVFGIGSGLLTVAFGVVILLVHRNWGDSGTRHNVPAAAFEQPAPRRPEGVPDAREDWDNLSAGRDFTRPPHGT